MSLSPVCRQDLVTRWCPLPCGGGQEHSTSPDPPRPTCLPLPAPAPRDPFGIRFRFVLFLSYHCINCFTSKPHPLVANRNPPTSLNVCHRTHEVAVRKEGRLSSHPRSGRAERGTSVIAPTKWPCGKRGVCHRTHEVAVRKEGRLGGLLRATTLVVRGDLALEGWGPVGCLWGEEKKKHLANAQIHAPRA